MISKKMKTMSLKQLMTNIANDCQEDADTGFSWKLTIEEYLKNLFDLEDEKSLLDNIIHAWKDTDKNGSEQDKAEFFYVVQRLLVEEVMNK